MSPDTVIGIVELAADVTKSVFQAEADKPTPSEFAQRLIEIGLNMVPINELRGYLDAADASSADRIVDIAEEAKLAAKKMGLP